MRCWEIMTIDVSTCHVDDTVADAARKMKARGRGFLPVCNERGMPLGVLTDRDIVLRIVAEGLDPSMRSVVDVMTLEIIACRRDDEASVAAQQMAHHHKSRVLVVDDDGVLCGVISLSDIAHHGAPADVGATLREVTAREVGVDVSSR